MTNIDRRAEDFDGPFDDVDRTIDAGTKSAGIRKEDVHGFMFSQYIAW